ncbi:MAG: helix-turn-helix transcriptional regulator [Actinomycetota bacterium]
MASELQRSTDLQRFVTVGAADHYALAATRQRLLDDGPRPVSPADVRDRDRAAHMLLYHHDPSVVLDLGLTHLVAELGSARGDAGILAPATREYHPTSVHADDPADVARIAATSLPNQHPVLSAAWRTPHPAAFDRVRGNRYLGTLEPLFTRLGATAMLATRMHVDGVGLGLLCVDEVDGARSWTPAAIDRAQGFVDQWLAPVLLAALVTAALRQSAEHLTPAEREAVDLLADGLSYGEIAHRLGKSVRTIDNQLRAARRKTGSRNAIELVASTRIES